MKRLFYFANMHVFPSRLRQPPLSFSIFLPLCNHCALLWFPSSQYISSAPLACKIQSVHSPLGSPSRRVGGKELSQPLAFLIQDCSRICLTLLGLVREMKRGAKREACVGLFLVN